MIEQNQPKSSRSEHKIVKPFVIISMLHRNPLSAEVKPGQLLHLTNQGHRGAEGYIFSCPLFCQVLGFRKILKGSNSWVFSVRKLYTFCFGLLALVQSICSLYVVKKRKIVLQGYQGSIPIKKCHKKWKKSTIVLRGASPRKFWTFLNWGKI